MSYDYLMYTASILFLICYIPDFYANLVNKNANIYNLFEKIVMLLGTTFALSYAIVINNNALIINYSPIIFLDFISVLMRCYYAYKNRNIDVRIINRIPFSENIHFRDVENPIHFEK